MSTEPISRRKLYHEIADRLLARLRAGEFAEEGRLPSERALMQAYEVGRPAVREALFSLERMGLIEIVHGERARLTQPTPASIIEQVAAVGQHMLAGSAQNLDYLKDARMFFETGMVRIAAARATEKDVARLGEILDEQAAALQDPVAFPRADQAFHACLAGMSGNPILAAISQAMFSWLERYHVSLVHTPGAEHLTLAEHRRIVDAVARGDAAAAVLAMQDHLTRANRLYLQEVGVRRQPA